MVTPSDVLDARRGSVEAPAGCGKTELIVRATAAQSGRVLVLTHTHAGVHALRKRFEKHVVPRERYVVDTIAGWCLRYCTGYPVRSGRATNTPTGNEWESIYQGAVTLLENRAVTAVVRASYDRVVVDEYQDCSRIQHALIEAIGRHVPVCVLGDPLQAIFGFRESSISWEDVQSTFPRLGVLNTPYRWQGRNEALGEWLLDIRDALKAGRHVSLGDAPLVVRDLSGASRAGAVNSLLDGPGTTVAIHKWADDAHAHARMLGGRLKSMEEMDGKDLMALAKKLDRSTTGGEAANLVLELAGEAMEGVTEALGAVEEGQPRNNPPLDGFTAALTAARSTLGASELVALTEAITPLAGPVFRAELWRDCQKMLRLKARGAVDSFALGAWEARQATRHIGRRLERGVSSRPLLIKGLEFENAVVVQPEGYEDPRRPGEGAKLFYVAASRASRHLVILTAQRQLRFTPVP